MTATSAAAAPAAATAIVISITLSTSSPTLQLSASDSEDPFYLLTTATITSCPDPDSDSPVTLHTGRFPAAVTALAAFPPDSGRTGLAAASPALQGHAIGDLVCRRGGGGGAEKRVQWDWARTNWVPPRNLREDRDLTWATVPAQGRGALVVRHYLPREKLRECGVVPGEVYRTGLDGAVAGACPVGFGFFFFPFRFYSSLYEPFLAFFVGFPFVFLGIDL